MVPCLEYRSADVLVLRGIASLTRAKTSEILTVRQSVIGNEVVKKVFQITTEILDFRICDEREDGRASVGTLVKLPAATGEGNGVNRDRLSI